MKTFLIDSILQYLIVWRPREFGDNAEIFKVSSSQVKWKKKNMLQVWRTNDKGTNGPREWGKMSILYVLSLKQTGVSCFANRCLRFLAFCTYNYERWSDKDFVTLCDTGQTIYIHMYIHKTSCGKWIVLAPLQGLAVIKPGYICIYLGHSDIFLSALGHVVFWWWNRIVSSSLFKSYINVFPSFTPFFLS